MAVKVEIPFRKTFEVAIAKDKAYAYLADVEKAIPGNFPGVERFDKIGDNAYQWVFESISQAGHNLAIRFATRFSFSPDASIAMSPHGPDPSKLTGRWDLKEVGGKTSVAFDANLVLELPLPFLLKAVAGPIAQREITKLFERYIGRVSSHLT